MDWIEHLLHVSPDGGSGIFEAAVAALVVAAVLAVPLRLRSARTRRRRS
jgi:hypothetical protein